MTSFAEYGRPLRVAGGLTARSTRGGIGEQWWSQRFVAVLESFALGTRLTRGRSYARQGQVLSLDVEPGVVTASVQGSRRTPYAVRIGFAALPSLAWAKVEVALAEEALCSAQLLAGEMPAELEELMAAAGARLFPERLADLRMSCSCPDSAVPCKHLAATFYLLAESFDDDPFRILHWRGRARDELLGRLRELRGGSGEAPAPVVRRAGAAAVLEGVVRTPGVLLPPLPVHPELPADLLLRQLPDPPAALGGEALRKELRALYERMSVPDEPSPFRSAR